MHPEKEWVRFGSNIENNIEEYMEKQQKRRKAKMKKAEVKKMVEEEFLPFFEKAKHTQFPEYKYSSSWENSVVLVSGREGRYLVDFLREKQIATWSKWSRSYSLEFDFSDFPNNNSDTLKRVMVHELKKYGFNIWIHTWYD